SVYRETVLEAAGPGHARPAKLRRDYEKATLITGGVPETLPFQGKAVLIERGTDGYHFTVEGGTPLTGAAALPLAREFADDDGPELQQLVLPKAAVRVNEAWKIDMVPFARKWQQSAGMQVDVLRSTGVGRLTRVYQKDGLQFGVMVFRLEMPVTSAGQARADAGSRALVEVTLDGCIDGRSATRVLRASFWVDGTAASTAPGGRPARLT